MRTVSATDARRRLATLLDAAQHEPDKYSHLRTLKGGERLGSGL